MKRKPYYSPTELAEEVDISHDTVLRMIHDGRLFAVKLSPRTYRVPLGAALAVFAPHEIRPGERVSLPPGTGEAFFKRLQEQEEDTDASESIDQPVSGRPESLSAL